MSYIEKEPLVDFITKGLNNPDKAKAFGHDAIEILTEIEFAPTLEVKEEPKKRGQWIYFRTSDGVKRCKCSECLTSYGCIDTPYCPNCGLEMDGGVA